MSAGAWLAIVAAVVALLAIQTRRARAAIAAEPTFDRERALDEVIAKELRDGVLPPPWERHPTMTSVSIGWRMGSGEEFMRAFGRWAQGRSAEELREYLRERAPVPRGWAWFAARLVSADPDLDPLLGLASLGIDVGPP